MSERPPVSLIQRFDESSAPTLTPREIKHRWIEFHRQIRLMSGTRFQRAAGRLLGEDTLRYRLARLLFRPLLRALRGRPRTPATTKLTATSAQAIFPVNYRPRQINFSLAINLETVDARDVAVVVVDSAQASAIEIIGQLNETLNETTAEWLFICDATHDDDERRYSAARLHAASSREHDVVFADESGPNPFAPILKSPAVGPHTLLSYNVVGRPALVRVETLFAVGGFLPEAGWAFEHDAYLRLSESGARFHHLNTVLPAGRTDRDFDPRSLNEDTRRVVAAALERRGWRGEVTSGELAGLAHWRIEPPTPLPRVDIIIPSRDRVELVRRCVASIEAVTTYSNYGIILLDNDSVEPATRQYFDDSPYPVVDCPGPFNYARIVNRGVSHSTAQFVVTLNNDTVVVTPDWLERLVALASLDDVGIVGACLMDPDGRREHEGIVIAPYPQHLRSDSNYPHDDPYVRATRDVAAVTGAVQMVRREFWESLGGMDEELAVVMNDVDVCLRSLMTGHYVLYTPDVELYHHVGSSRGSLDPIEDRNRFIRRWDIFGTFRDPFFAESLLLLGEKMFYFPRDS